ncbi:MAG: aminotransferase class I/II-fold pyridoxal phosphate-dependent enzyme [Thaumarchaeota archaeon]|nr:aminotransferase class I/II-fold pyridoxal phosphate-dependent enzyme [Nitrososphaerota archaeon]
MKVSRRVKEVEYAIRDIVVYAKELERKGRDILYLNIGDPVAYDFKTPEHIKKALINSIMQDETNYAPSEGVQELRSIIAEKEREKGLNAEPSDVLVTNGVSEAVDMVMGSILDDGDEILVPGPCYPPYSSYAKLHGGNPVEYRSIEDNGWLPDMDDIRSKITSKTVALTVISPNNPTGAVYDDKTLKELVQIAAENNLYLLCDEIYDKIIFDEEFVSIARYANDVPLIMLNGFSKVYLMTGLRLGYICMNSGSKALDDLHQNIPKLARVRIASNTPAQKAAIAALYGPDDHIKDMVKRLRERRNYIMKRLDAVKRISYTEPEGAFYIFPKIDLDGSRWKSDADFVIDLLKTTGVLSVHGSGFGKQYGQGHFRMVFLPPLEMLEEAMNRLEKFMSSN